VRTESLPSRLLSGICFAGVVTSLRRLRDFEPAVLVAPNNIVTAPLYAPYALSQDIWPTGSQSIFLVGFGMFQIGRPYVILPASCGR